MKKSLISFVLITAALLYAAWSWVFQTGLYAMLVRWQAATFDTYFPSLTFAAIFIALLCIIYIIERMLGVSGEKKKGDMDVSLEELQTRFKKRTRFSVLAMLVFAIAGFASFFFGQTAPGDKQEALKIDLNNFDQTNHWFRKVELNGVLLIDKSYSITSKSTKRGRTSQTLYTPIATKGSNQAPIQFVHLKKSNHNLRVNSSLALKGFVSPSVLPVLVRDYYEENGLNLADKVHVIGDGLVSLQMALYIAAGILGFISFMFLVTMVFSPIGRRRITKEWHAVNGKN